MIHNLLICISCSLHLYRVESHEHSEAAQMMTYTHSMCAGVALLFATVCGPGPFLSPVRTDILHLHLFIRLLFVLQTKQNHYIKSWLHASCIFLDYNDQKGSHTVLLDCRTSGTTCRCLKVILTGWLRFWVDGLETTTETTLEKILKVGFTPSSSKPVRFSNDRLTEVSRFLYVNNAASAIPVKTITRNRIYLSILFTWKLQLLVEERRGG